VTKEVDRLRAKKKQIYEDLKGIIGNEQPEWNYLTYAEMREIVDTHAIAVATVMVELAEAIEAKVKEKNA